MFEKKYTIIEYKNQLGENYFCVKYSNWLMDLFDWLIWFDKWVSSYGGLHMNNDYDSCRLASLEKAKQAIESREQKLKESAEKAFKPSSIYYV